MDTLQTDAADGVDADSRPIHAAATLAASAAMLSACGGDDPASANAPEAAKHAKLKHAAASISGAAASRFLSQAAFGGNDADIAAVQSQGYAGWLQSQFTTASGQDHWLGPLSVV